MMTKSNWSAVYATTAAIMAISLGLLLWATPRKDGAFAWFDPMIAGGWMAWTFPVALFFYLIACLLVIFTILAIRFPETPRIGVLHIETTRGDRLFISLLGSAFITLGWLALIGASLWGALILCLIYAAAVFRWV
jgi:predicted small integral membrane protein